MRYYHNNIFKLFLYCCFLFSGIIFSQENKVDYSFISINQDLSHKAVTNIIQDHQGVIWIGSQGYGLNKYNGIDIVNYRHEWGNPNTINSSRIYCIYLDSNNQIWVGTENGLNLYNRDLDQFINIPIQASNDEVAVHAIHENNNEELIIGTHKYGLFKLNITNHNHKKILFSGTEKTKNIQINSILKTVNGSILIGTNIGLMLYDPLEDKFELAKFETLNGFETITSSIHSIIISKNKSIWLGTFSDGLLEICSTPTNHYQFKKHNITTKRIFSLAKSPDGYIFCGTENDGLFVVNEKGAIIKNYRHDKTKKEGIKSNSIWSVFVDKQHRIWLGYYNHGVDVYDEKVDKFNKIESHPYGTQSLYSSAVTAISKDKMGRLWIGMLDGGVDVYNPKNKEFTHLYKTKNPIAKGLNSPDIQTVFIDSKENVWVGTWSSGIYLLKKNSKTFQNITIENSKNALRSNRVMSFSEDSKGIIWIGTYFGGLHSYTPQLNTYQHHSTNSFNENELNFNNIRKVIIDSQDNIWVGALAGLFKIVRNGNTNFKVVSMNNKLDKSALEKNGPKVILSVLEDSNKNIWIGTEGHGLFQYTPSNDSIISYYKKSNLIQQTVSSIVEAENGNIWISGIKGLSEFNIEKNSFTNYSSSDGLLSNNFNHNAVLKDQEGILYFGNYKGIDYFNPKNIEKNLIKPTVYLSGFKLFNKLTTHETENSPLTKSISETKNLTLQSNHSVFTIEYIGTNYTRTENNQYAYYLEGFEKEWNYVENSRSATYTNIPPGNYSFKVKSANNDGVWNETPTVLNIRILSPWWKTKIAFLVYLLVFGLISFLIFRFINQRLKEKRLIRIEREDRKQKEVLNAKKIQFFTNISHEFRTPLTLILTPLEDIIGSTDLQFSNEVKEKHNIIFKNAKRLSRLINELMDFRKLQFNKMPVNASKINAIPFIEEITSHFQEEAILKSIDFSVEYDENNIFIWSDPSMLEKIIFNLISNAFKATPKGGLVTIQINKPKDLILLPLVDENNPVPVIEIIIKDTGLGIKEENLDKVFDRFYQANEMNDQYYGGTGIGLELVKSFVDLHKGKIVLTSKENVGTQFKIYLPLGHSHIKEDSINTKKVINKYSEASKEILDEADLINEKETSNKKMVLIVEDNVELRTYIKNELKKEYIVKEAENGQEGLELVNKFIPDIIITDVMMPIMDGFELCKRIKTNLKTSHIPLLMVTAKGMQIDKIKGIDSGADVYLNKPFNMKILKSHLKQLITSRQILFDKYFNGISESNINENTTSLDKEFIVKVLDYIHENISDSSLNVENLAEELFLSRNKLYLKIKALTGSSANEFLRTIRLEKAKQLIETTDFTISEICYQVGFSSPSYFTKCFRVHFKILPTEIRNTPS